MFRVAVISAWLAAGAACSGDAPTPIEKCKTLVEDICARGVDCVGGTLQDCVTATQRDFACESVQNTSSSYNQCVEETNMAACSTLYPTDASGQAHLELPASCASVFSR